MGFRRCSAFNCTNIQPNEVFKPSEQIPPEVVNDTDMNNFIDPETLKKEPLDRKSTRVTQTTKATEDKLVPSEDLDLTGVTTKPPPRESVQPTYRGWKEVGHWEQEDALTFEDEITDLLSRGSVFDKYLPSVAYGDWYHNVGYLIGAALLSWLLGWFRFSVAPVFFVMVVSAILYRTSIKKYRTALREHAQREFSVKLIEDDYETMDWLNTFLEKFWWFLEPSIAQIVCDQVNPILAALPAPGFVKALWIDSFTAGTKPPRIDKVKTLHGTNDDIVVMDWGFSFTPNAIVDSTVKQMRNAVNQKVVVKANLFGFKIPVSVSDVAVKGIARVRLRMMTSFPHVETVNLSLLEPPQIDFNTLLMGSWEVLTLPGLYPFINEMIKKYVGTMIFTPLSFQINLQQLLAGNALDAAIGVLVIDVKSARGLREADLFGNSINPYVTFGFMKDVLAKTKVKTNTTDPVWKEKHYIPVKSLSEPLNISVVDHNERRSDRQIGLIQFDLERMIDNDKQPDLKASIIHNNKPVGELSFGFHFLKTLEPVRQVDGAVLPPPDLNTGIARIEVSGARHLKGGDKGATLYAEIYIDGENVNTTAVKKGTNEPAWGVTLERIVHNRSKTRCKVVVKEQSGKTLGLINARLNELIDATQVGQPWFPLTQGGEVNVACKWKPVPLVDLPGLGGYTPPIGAVRVSIQHGEDLRNLEHIGKVDPYARFLVNGVVRLRTTAIESTLNPTWNEVHYFTISSPNQKLTIEVMDVEKHSADRTLGSFDVMLNELISKDEKGQYLENIDHKKRSSKLIHKKGPKGSVTYSIGFIPALPVMTHEEYREEEEEKKKELKIKEKKEKEEAEKKKKEEANGEKEANSTPIGKKEEKNPVDPEVQKENEEIEDEVDSSKLRLSLQELLEYKSGALVFEISEGTVLKDDLYLQAFFDNHGHADFTSSKLKRQNKIGMTGDVVIKELEWSKATFRLVKDKDDNRAEEPVAELNVPTLQLLKNGFDKPIPLDLGGAANGQFKVQFDWVPIIYKSGIPPQDSKDNLGNLTVDVIRAEGLMSADRNGKSDPFVELFLDTDKESFFKTKKVKKTLEPTWNESYTVPVFNKYDSVIKVVCFDWDIGPEKNDLLGVGYLELADVPTNGDSIEMEVNLTTEEETDGGVVYFKLSFKPDFILNVKAASGTNIGDAFGSVGNVGLGAGKGVAKGVGKGLGGGVKVLKKGLHFGRGGDLD